MKNNYINYVEFMAKDLEKTKTFYGNCFNWSFTDYGPDYTAFSDSGVEGGFRRSEDDITNGVLIVIYHKDLKSIKKKVVESNGIISKDIFSFPGGRRFHFLDPSGNELAIWSDK